MSRIRGGAYALMAVAGTGSFAQLDHSRSPLELLAAALAIAVLEALTLLTFLRVRIAPPEPLLTGPLVVVVGINLVDPMATIGFVFSIAAMLSLYGSRRTMLIRLGLLSPTIPLVIALSPNSDQPWRTPSVLFLGLVPWMAALLLRTLKGALELQSEISRRDGLLASVSRRLLGCTDPGQVAAVMDQAWQSLRDITPGLVLAWVGDEGGRGFLDLPRLSEEYQRFLGDVYGKRRHWNAVRLEGEQQGPVAGADLLVIGLDRPIPQSLIDTASTLGIQSSMAVSICKAYAELEHRAHHDTLTAMPNRAMVIERLTRAVDETQTLGTTAAVMIIDLDGFKVVNDSYGHEAGDALLIEIGRRMSAAVGEHGTAARFGGDEFAVVLPRVPGLEMATELAHQVCARLLAPVQLPMATLTVGCSIGMALSEVDRTAAELIRRADIAMYSAKAGGKGRVEVFSEQLHGAAAASRRMSDAVPVPRPAAGSSHVPGSV